MSRGLLYNYKHYTKLHNKEASLNTAPVIQVS